MVTFLDITTGERPSINLDDNEREDLSLPTSQENLISNKSIFDELKKAFNTTNTENNEPKENIFAQNSSLNIFVSNVIDDKQDIIDNLSKVIDKKLDNIDEKLYKVDELIEKFAKCKLENEQLRANVSNLRNENYVLKNELGRFSKVLFGVFLKK